MADADRKVQESALVRREQQITARGLDEYPRFWGKVDRSGECWNWTASKLPNGYGQINVDGKHYTAHRFCWQIVYGSIPQGYCVLHRCDNRACVRPSHLFLGTTQDNTLDRQLKWRTRRGEQHYAAKVTEDQVREMRRRYDLGELAAHIADDFGIERRHGWLICTRKRWKHVSP
jgi:Autographiviridae endonuclease